MIGNPRRYRALALAMAVTLVTAAALFAYLLDADLERAERTFATEMSRSAARGEERLTWLLERTAMLGQVHLGLGVGRGRLSGMIDMSGLGETLETVCVREDGAPRIVHADAEVAVTALAAARCAEDFTSQRTLALRGDGRARTIDVRIVPSPQGSRPPSLEVRLRDDDERELRASLSTEALLALVAPGIAETSVPVAGICLSLLVDERLRPVVCRDDVVSARSAAASRDAFEHVEVLESAGLLWQLRAIPDYRALSDDLTPLPFYAFGAALALGGLVCLFIHVTVDKNLRLESDAVELQRLLERLETQNAELDQFAVMAAHDLQAPMRFVVANAHLLVAELEALERSDLSQIGTTLVEQGERMRALVLDLLDFCRAGQTDLELAPTDVGALVDEEIRLLRTAEAHRRTRITVRPLPRALPCDASKLEQILRNLLGNAVKFSHQGPSPSVSISAERDEGHGRWIFRIEDNGPGIDAAHRERVFLPFNRLDRATEGTGIGLAIVKKLVERHGGRIWLDPQFTGGSAFCFTLPCTTRMETP